ncbi:hypothetical protein [Streptomyces sp. NPDC056291]|uniref:hypothetical protein n=1 Tax=Streptomyces sp. NPDC056291 TaxID=3345772 RepID=UPI0035D9A404
MSRLQCKDIPDATFLDAVRASPAGVVGWRTRFDVHEKVEEAIGQEIPTNLLMAKARRLESRGLLGGCTCGCRGDWHPSDECTLGEVCCPGL